MIRAAVALALLVLIGSSVRADFVGFAGGAFLQGSAVLVPDVVGLSLTDADTALEGEGLDTGVVTVRCSLEDADEVLSQFPIAGTAVLPGSTVDVLASNGEECAPGRPGVRLRGLRIGL